jgi:hypothetical protein
LGFEAIKGLDWHWSRSTFGGLGGRLHQLGENWRTLAISPSTFETFEGLAGIATDLALFGFFPKTPNAAKQPNSGQVAASRGNSRVIFLMSYRKRLLAEGTELSQSKGAAPATTGRGDDLD